MKNKALFIDRDGVINVDKDYVFKISDFEFTDGAFELCKYFQFLNYKIFIITNQSGIARGYFSIKDLNLLHDWMLKCFSNEKIFIEKIYYCPHHPEFDMKCKCRKPQPGMILKAAEEYNIDLSKSLLIGDKNTDLEAGKNAGVKNLILIKKNNTIDLLNNLKNGNVLF